MWQILMSVPAHGDGWGHHWWPMGPGMMGPTGGWVMGAWVLSALVVIALVVALVAWLGRSGGSRSAGTPGPLPSDPALAELRRRYATGEISREEYFQRKTDLEQ